MFWTGKHFPLADTYVDGRRAMDEYAAAKEDDPNEPDDDEAHAPYSQVGLFAG